MNLLCVAVVLVGQSVHLPPEISAQPREWIIVPAKVVGGPAKWRLGPGLEEVRLDSLFGEDVLSKAKGRVVKAPKEGTYFVEAWNALDSKASDIAVCRIVVGTPPIDDPPPDDGGGKPPPKVGGYYFLIVRADGPATPKITELLGDPAWAALKAKGHRVKDKTAAEAATLKIVVAADKLPAVVTLKVAADGKTSSIVRPAVALPATGADVAKLVEGLP